MGMAYSLGRVALCEDGRVNDYVSVNLANWNSRVPHHLGGYDLASFSRDPHFISDVVRFDRERLGALNDLDVVHLQCHIGTDTLSLARLGARSVTGLDFSAPALEAATDLAHQCDTKVDYVLSEIYGALDVLGEDNFDLVYTGVGALCWLPNIQQWAAIVARLLRRGGRLFLREFHPIVWAMCDPRPDGLLVVEYPYFENEGVTFFSDKSYVAHDGVLDSPESRVFNHGVGEIVTALLDAGLTLRRLEEHRSAPSMVLEDMVKDTDTGEYRLRKGIDTLPLTYTLIASKSD